jgi:hypothetical protein
MLVRIVGSIDRACALTVAPFTTSRVIATTTGP